MRGNVRLECVNWYGIHYLQLPRPLQARQVYREGDKLLDTTFAVLRIVGSRSALELYQHQLSRRGSYPTAGSRYVYHIMVQQR